MKLGKVLFSSIILMVFLSVISFGQDKMKSDQMMQKDKMMETKMDKK